MTPKGILFYYLVDTRIMHPLKNNKKLATTNVWFQAVSALNKQMNNDIIVKDYTYTWVHISCV